MCADCDENEEVTSLSYPVRNFFRGVNHQALHAICHFEGLKILKPLPCVLCKQSCDFVDSLMTLDAMKL